MYVYNLLNCLLICRTFIHFCICLFVITMLVVQLKTCVVCYQIMTSSLSDFFIKSCQAQPWAALGFLT